MTSPIRCYYKVSDLCYNLHCVPVQDDDSVIDCVFNDETGTVVVQASHDIGHSNEVLSNVSHNSISIDNAVLYVIPVAALTSRVSSRSETSQCW